WFMQDGTRLHTANVVLDFLHNTSNSHVISNRFPDRFAYGQNWSQTVIELRALIIQGCNKKTEDMCHQVINIITVHVEVAKCNGNRID
ncbi:hypothetical protein B7P43_G00006, partial [Cryptotermes secundus]